MAGQINLPALVTSLNIDMSGIVGSQAEATREGTVLGERLGDAMRRRLQVAVESLPDIEITADTSAADRELAELRQSLATLADRRIGVDVSIEEATREIEQLQTHLGRLEVTHPDVQVTADIGEALSALAQVTEAARQVDQLDPVVEVHVDEDRSAERAGRDFERMASSALGAVRSLGGMAASAASASVALGAVIPVVAGLVAVLAGIAPAAGVAAAGVLSIGSAVAVIKVGTAGVGAAFKAAFAPAVSGGGAAAASAGQAAAAQRALRDATQSAAEANAAAARRVEDAERSLTDAQRSARQAQQDLNDARTAAARDLEDLNNQLIDAGLDQRENALRVQQATEALNDVMADPSASEAQRQQAQLTYDRAVQRLSEQGLAYQRLQAKAAEAAAAGVEGSKRVADAQARVADANRSVEDRTRSLADAQDQQARTAQKGLEQIAAAQEALAQGAAAAAGAVDPLAQAMARLAPSARAFVEQVIALKPQLAALRLDVQQRLFEGLDVVLARVASATLPVLHSSLVTSAGHLNSMAREAGATAVQLSESGTLGRALASANKGLGSLSRLPAVVVQGLVSVAAAAGPAFERLTASGGRALDRLSQKLGEGLQSGGMQAAIEQAIALLGQLGRVIGDVGRTFGSVLGAANASGGSFLQTLGQITGAVAGAFASPQVQGALQALFGVVASIATTAAPLLIQALQVLAPVIAALVPGVQVLITALGTALQPVIAALGPVLVAAAQAVAGLVTALAPLLPLVGTLVAGLLPALTPIFAGIAQVAALLAPLVAELATALGDALAPVFAALPGIIAPLVEIMIALTVALLPVLTQLVVALAPSLTQLGQSFAQVMTALAPLLEAFAVLISKVLQALMPLLEPIIKAVGLLAEVFASKLAAIVTQIVVPALQVVTRLLQGDLSGAVEAGKEVLRGLGRAVLDVFRDLPIQIGSIFAQLGRELWEAGGKIISALVDGIKNKAGNVKGALSDVLSSARNLLPFSPAREGPFSGSGWSLYSGQSIPAALAEGILSGLGVVQAATAQLMSAAHGPLEGALGFAGNASALTGAYAGMGRPIQQNNVINLYGSTVTARDVSDELSWRANVGVR